MTPNERELSQQLFGGQERGSASIFPGLSLDKITSDLGKEFSHQAAAGAHELAAALFSGNAFVMYQRDGRDDQPVQDQAQNAQNMQQDPLGQQQERGGRSM